MFCFSTTNSHRKNRADKKSSSLAEFSQSASALNRLPVPEPECRDTICRSDSNISSLQSFSIIKSAVRIKSILNRSGCQDEKLDTDRTLKNNEVLLPRDAKGGFAAIAGESLSDVTGAVDFKLKLSNNNLTKDKCESGVSTTLKCAFYSESLSEVPKSSKSFCHCRNTLNCTCLGEPPRTVSSNATAECLPVSSIVLNDNLSQQDVSIKDCDAFGDTSSDCDLIGPPDVEIESECDTESGLVQFIVGPDISYIDGDPDSCSLVCSHGDSASGYSCDGDLVTRTECLTAQRDIFKVQVMAGCCQDKSDPTRKDDSNVSTDRLGADEGLNRLIIQGEARRDESMGLVRIRVEDEEASAGDTLSDDTCRTEPAVPEKQATGEADDFSLKTDLVVKDSDVRSTSGDVAPSLGDIASSSGNSSTSDTIAPMASPEPLSPPESGVCSPALLEPADISPCPSIRCQLIHEGDMHVCRLNHTRTIVSKVLSSKFLRRWEHHRVILGESQVTSKTPTGFLEQPVPYTNILDVYVVQRWDNKFCIRLVLPEGSLLLQTGNGFLRDTWEYSIKWKRCMNKYRWILSKSSRPQVILKEIKNLVEFSIMSPVQDESALSVPISIISSLLDEKELWESRVRREEVIEAMAPLLENTPATAEMCRFFSSHCQLHPRSPVIASVFTPIVHCILRRNADFGKSPQMRRFVADFVKAIHSQNNGDEAVHSFVSGVHGPVTPSPQLRVLPNLVAATFAAIFSYYEQRRAQLVSPSNETDTTERSQAVNPTEDNPLQCYLTVFHAISELEDWRRGLAALLQPVPLPDDALLCPLVMAGLSLTIARIAADERCSVHSMLLGARPGKEGWLQLFCPSNNICTDGGALWCQILETLMRCCCRRKGFISELTKQVGALQLVALRDQSIGQEILCLMLEWGLLPTEEQLQVVTTLNSTETGRQKYLELCKRQEHLRLILEQKGGPRKLTLPSRSTDADLAKLLSAGGLGNLECLSLAFTNITSACADYLIQLPSLKCLNLWSTQFGDAGLQTIADHLTRLQVLNLCETLVTDKGIACISGMANLRKLNLNSTKLSAETLEKLKAELPALEKLDVRYTDAW